MDKFAVIDTETNWNDEVMSMRHIMLFWMRRMNWRLCSFWDMS